MCIFKYIFSYITCFVLFCFSLFCLWFPSFLSLLPPCRVLLRTWRCLVITVWLSPVLLKSPAGFTALQPLLPLVVVLCRGFALLSFSHFFGVGPLSLSSVCWLAFLFECETPSIFCPPCVLPWFSAAPVWSSVVGQWISVFFVWSCVG